MTLPSQRDRPAVLARVYRGYLVESTHRGHICVTDPAGRSLFSAGDAGTVTFLRSCAKPLQAAPLIGTGAADRFGFSEKAIAIACGSHLGLPAQVEVVREMLHKAGLEERHLKCGVHPPYYLRRTGRTESPEIGPIGPLHNNCSGKHAGLLAAAAHVGADLETYLEPSHPIQRLIYEEIARLSGCALETATDGCGLPTFALPIGGMARMFARLASEASGRGGFSRPVYGRIFGAMTREPEMVSGSGELDTKLMRAGGGRLISKIGAEGVYVAAVLPSERWPDGLGIALKIEDGSERARPAVVRTLLARLGIELKWGNENFAETLIRNHQGSEVGEIRSDLGPAD